MISSKCYISLSHPVYQGLLRSDCVLTCLTNCFVLCDSTPGLSQLLLCCVVCQLHSYDGFITGDGRTGQ